MRNTIFALMLAAAVILPSTVLAGEGSTYWYSSWFNDRAEHEDYPLTYNTWILASNPNSYNSTLKITYYKPDGSKYAFNGYSTFTHTVSGNGYASWRPNLDLGQNAGDELKGSFEIIVTDGSVDVEALTTAFAGDLFDDSQSEYYNTQYHEGDKLYSMSAPCQTVSSTYLTMDAILHKDSGDNIPVVDGERVSWIFIANPSATQTAEAVMRIFDSTGSAYDIDDNNDDGDYDNTTVTISLAPHASTGFTPGTYDLGISGTAVSGRVELNVKKGSMMGSYWKIYCDELYNTDLGFSAYGSSMHKRLNIK